MVSILGDYSYCFPKPIPLKLKLKDLLEKEVDEKYYLSDKQIKCLSSDKVYKNGYIRGNQFKKNINPDVCTTITASSSDRASDTFVLTKNTENYIEWEDGKNIQMNCRAWKDDKVIATLNTGGETKILIKNATKKGYLEATDNGGKDRGVCVGTYQYAKSDKFMNGKDRLQLGKETSDTLQTSPKEGVCYNDLRIRKLTPRECGRLMGVKDKDITNMLKNQSNSSAYHCFGDSIICTVLCAIFGELLNIDYKNLIESWNYNE